MSAPTSLKEFITTHYDIIHAPEIPLESCNTFFLAESHMDEQVRALNGLFISTFATPGSRLLVEGQDALRIPYGKKFTRIRYCIKTENIKHICGWDIENYVKLLDIPKTIRQLARYIFTHTSPEVKIDWLNSLYEATEQYLSSLVTHSHLRFTSANKHDTKEYIITFSNMINHYDSEFIEPIQKKLLIVMEEIKTLKRNSVPDDAPLVAIKLSEREALALEIAKLRTHYITFLTLQDYTSFQARTDSLIKTVTKVRSTLGGDKLFLIAGASHLVEHPKLSTESPELVSLRSLAPFKAFLASYPDIVILQPKSITAAISAASRT